MADSDSEIEFIIEKWRRTEQAFEQQQEHGVTPTEQYQCCHPQTTYPDWKTPLYNSHDQALPWRVSTWEFPLIRMLEET